VVGGQGSQARGPTALALPFVDLFQFPEAEQFVARCRCGATHPVGEAHRCVGAEAFDHTRRVAARAELLIARMEAVRALGTLDGPLRPLAAFAERR